MTFSRRPGEVDNDARRRHDRERLEHAARVLLTSDGWQRWTKVRATNGLARYSLSNQLLIALQRPDATFVAGFRAFLSLNRCVRQGEKAIRILAPTSITRSARQSADDEENVRTIFRAVPVLDVAQTEPISGQDPVPLVPPRQPITDSHVHMLLPLEQLANELGYRLRSTHPPTVGATTNVARSSSTTACQGMVESASWCTSSLTHSAWATASTVVVAQRCSSTPSPTSSADQSASMCPKTAFPMSPVGARPALSMPFASMRERLMPSPGG